jgi:hypothetical protein
MAGDEGASLFVESFLRFGAGDWSDEDRARYPGLASFRGVKALKDKLRELAGSSPGLPVLLANRSAQLMRLAASLLFQSCRNVLVTDIGWPPYHEILAAEAARTARSITLVRIRDMVLEGTASAEEVLAVIRAHYLQSECDGLFLTGVSHLGVRLPVEELVKSLAREPRFVVVDGAQEFCHVPAELRNDYCDLYLAGCHKWLQAYLPMGLAFFGRKRSRFAIEGRLNQLLAAGELDDPLLRFSTQIELDALDGCTETVSLGCLFTCQGAVDDALESRLPSSSFPRRLASLESAAAVAAESDWEPLHPQARFRTGILLLRAARGQTHNAQANELRCVFSDHGVALTAYERGIFRLSMPADGWQPGELDHLRAVLEEAARKPSRSVNRSLVASTCRLAT